MWVYICDDWIDGWIWINEGEEKCREQKPTDNAD